MSLPEEPIVIKRYADRLYNIGTATYVTLEDLAAMARMGHDLTVYDATSGEDITRSILMLITPITPTEH
jgi:polyhydroxyalkanoate synthesis repressor PhaR